MIKSNISTFRKSYKELYGTVKGFEKSNFFVLFEYTQKKQNEYKERTGNKTVKGYEKSKEFSTYKKSLSRYEKKISNEFFNKELKEKEYIETKDMPFFAAVKPTQKVNKATGKQGKKLLALSTDKEKPTIYSIVLDVPKNSIFDIKPFSFSTQDFQKFQVELQKINFKISKIKLKNGNKATSKEIYESITSSQSIAESTAYNYVNYNFNVLD